MSTSTTLAIPNLTMRWILQRDLPAILEIEQQPPVPQWTEEEFRAVFQSADTAGCIAEMGHRAVGFLIYRVALHPAPFDISSIGRLRWRSQRGEMDPGRSSLRVTLLNMAVAPEWRRHGIGRALLRRIGQKLQHPHDSIQATVPESNLAVQCLLRDAGYKAMSVCRGFYESEDGYLMQRQGG